MNYLSENVAEMNALCKERLCAPASTRGGGGVGLPVKEISIPLTNKCNGHCIMCHACSEQYENHTYHNEPPYETSLRTIQKIFPRPKRSVWERMRGATKSIDAPIDFFFGSAESFLNRQCYEIFQYLKSVFPRCRIKLISNGTIPPIPPEIVKYIDFISFSVDGCTAETYEFLRPPAKFGRTMETIRKWDEAAAQYNPGFRFAFSTVVSSKNISELGGILELASSFQHIDSVFLQPITLHESLQHRSGLLLKQVSRPDGERYLEAARQASAQKKLPLYGMENILSAWNHAFGQADAPAAASPQEENHSRYCRYLWNGNLALDNEGRLRYPCCFMIPVKSRELLERYHIPLSGDVREIYNSDAYWVLRKDMLDGKLCDFCVDCSLQHAGYENMKSTKANLRDYIIHPENYYWKY